MTAIWMEQANGVWSLQQAARYDNEQALHDIVMNTPELLPLSGAPRLTTSGHLEPGVQPFRDLLSDTPDQYRPTLTLMAEWTEQLVSTHPGLTAATYFGLAGDVSLLPRLKDENVGLVTLWRYSGGKPAISFWRSVLSGELLNRSPQPSV